MKKTKTLLQCHSVIRCPAVLIIALVLSMSVPGRTDNATSEAVLRVYLAREVTIENNIFSLGQVAIVRGDESLVTKAGQVTLGRISMPGQKIVLDRNVILSRLASSGISASQVTLTGAEKTVITRKTSSIKGSDFVELAGTLLKANPSVQSVSRIDPVNIPADMVIPAGDGEVKLVGRLIGIKGNSARVQVAALLDGRLIDTREVAFALRYICNKAVALVDLPKGTTLSPENVKIRKDLADSPQPADWTAPYGLVAIRPIEANSVVTSRMLSEPKPQVLIRRNQIVVLRIDNAGLLITASAKALQDGHAGEHIKVRNADSKRIILAKVREDGTVEPVL